MGFRYMVKSNKIEPLGPTVGIGHESIGCHDTSRLAEYRIHHSTRTGSATNRESE